MKWWTIRALAVVALMLLLMHMFGNVRFTPSMSDGLVRVANRLGVHGDEDIEDLYLSVTALISFAASLSVVAGTDLFRLRRGGEGTSGKKTGHSDR